MQIQRFRSFLLEGQLKPAASEIAKVLEDEGFNINQTHSLNKGMNIIVKGQQRSRDEVYDLLMNNKALSLYNPERVINRSLSKGEKILSLNNGVKIIVKDPGKQTINKSSNNNETWLVNQINQLVEKGEFNLTFISKMNGKKIVLKNISGAKQVQTATSNNKDKADIEIIYNNGKRFACSIKAIDASFFAALNSDKVAEKIAMDSLNYAVKHKLVELISHDNDYDQKLTKSIAIFNIDPQLVFNWMFGSDIKTNGAIICYDYMTSALKEISTGYELAVKFIVQDENDVTVSAMGDHYPELMILNHAGKRLGKIKGINARLASKKRAQSAVQIDYNKII